MDGRRSEHLEEFQPPRKKLNTDGDELIKRLSRKQLNTRSTLREELSHEKRFEGGAELLAITNYQSGECSARRLEEVASSLSEIEELKATGLDEGEIGLYLAGKEGFENVVARHPKHEAGLLREKLLRIQGVVGEYKENHKSNELAENCNSEKSNLCEEASGSTSCQETHFRHPMDQIRDIKAELEAHLNSNSPPVEKIRSKARKLARRIESAVNTDKIESAVSCKDDSRNLSGNSSKWDVRTREDPIKRAVIVEKKVYTCGARQLYTIKDGEIVKVGEKREEIATSGEKMGLEDIVKIKSFQGYTPGVPNKILFLKNLPNKITEVILRKILQQNGVNHEVDINILNGRMRGAFVTFTDEFQATQALQCLNGLLINAKPIIVEYGRKK